MLRSKVAKLTFTALSLGSALAQIELPEEAARCEGRFDRNLNTAFIDCFDEEGNLTTTLNKFFKRTLARECEPIDTEELE